MYLQLCFFPVIETILKNILDLLVEMPYQVHNPSYGGQKRYSNKGSSNSEWGNEYQVIFYTAVN